MTLPETLSFPPLPESTDDSDPATEEKDDDMTYLPEMKPVFLPPPFTPSNQVFVHLADVANKQSLALRSEAEERIRNFIKAEAAGILEKEKTLRGQVLCFWKEFKQHLGELQLDMKNRKARSPTRLGDHTGTNGPVSAHGIPSSLAIRSFAPAPMSSVHHPVSPPQPRISALSASIATSTFHYPKESRRLSSEIRRPSPDSNDDLTSISSTLDLYTAGHGEEANVLQFRRTINEDINTQASYRYFVNLEEDMERSKRNKEVESKREKDDRDERVAPTASLPAEVDTQKSDVNETVSHAKESQNETSPPRGRDKGKRKVTFDVKPTKVAVENDAKAAVAPDQGYFITFPRFLIIEMVYLQKQYFVWTTSFQQGVRRFQMMTLRALYLCSNNLHLVPSLSKDDLSMPVAKFFNLFDQRRYLHHLMFGLYEAHQALIPPMGCCRLWPRLRPQRMRRRK